MARILVTGSKGVVGKILFQELLDRGHRMYGVDLMHAEGEVGWEQTMAEGYHSYSRCDVADFRQLERVVRWFGPDIVYHAAAEFGRWNGEDFYEQVWRTNAIGTKNIIRLQEELDFKLVHFSSSEVYGDYEGIMREGIPAELPIHQLNDYAMSKWVNEMQIKNSAKLHKTKTVIVRLFNTYGPGETYNPYRSVNSRFIHHALNGLPIYIYGTAYRTSTYLNDTCRTLANIADNFIAGETYNIGGEEYHSIEDLAKIIWEEVGADPKLIKYVDSEPLTTRTKRVDVSKSIRDLDHKNTVSLREGIKLTLKK